MHSYAASIKGGVYFEENSATTGGAIDALYPSLKTDEKLYFLNNVGGAISIAASKKTHFSVWKFF